MTFQGTSLEICEDCGQFGPSGEGLALVAALIGAIPLAALGTGLALSDLPARWTRPWVERVVRAALIAQGGCLGVSVLMIALAVGMLASEFDRGGALFAPVMLLHTAVNVAGIVAWRRVAEAQSPQNQPSLHHPAARG
jgi:hypothetical protein